MKKISKTQIFWISLAIVLPNLILAIPQQLSQVAQQTAWISIIIIGVIANLLHYAILTLSCKFSNNNIIQDSINIFGSLLGRIIIFPYIFAIITANFFISLQTINFFEIVMRQIPDIIFWILLGLLLSYLVYTDIETIVRVVTIGMPMIIFFTLLIVISIFIVQPELVTINNLKPIVINLKSIAKGSIIASVWFLILPIILLILKPFFKNNKNAIKNSLLGNLFSQVLSILLFIITISAFGVNLTSTLFFPYFRLTRITILRIEIVILALWFSGYIFKLGIFYFCSVKALSDWGGLKDHRKIIIPTSILIIVLSMYSNKLSLASLTLKYSSLGYSLFYIITLISFIIIYSIAIKYKNH